MEWWVRARSQRVRIVRPEERRTGWMYFLKVGGKELAVK